MSLEGVAQVITRHGLGLLHKLVQYCSGPQGKHACTPLRTIPDLQSGEAWIVAHEWWGPLDEGVSQGHHGEWRTTHPGGPIAIHGQPCLGHLHLGSIHERLPCWDLHGSGRLEA